MEGWASRGGGSRWRGQKGEALGDCWATAGWGELGEWAMGDWAISRLLGDGGDGATDVSASLLLAPPPDCWARTTA